MMTPRDPDEILAAWLDEGPTRIPDQTRRAIAVALPTTTRRRRAWRVPWRYQPMSPLARTAAAILVIAVVVGGTWYIFKPVAGTTGSTPSPSVAPTVAPSAAAVASPCVTPMIVGVSLTRLDCRYVSTVMASQVVNMASQGGGGGSISLAGDAAWKPVSEHLRSIQLNASFPGGEPNMEGVAITIVDRYAAKPCQSTGEMTDRSTVPVPDMPPGLDYEFFGFLSATPLGPIDKSEATIAGHPGLVATIPLPDGALPECGGAVYYTWTGTNEQDRGAQGFVSGLDWKVYAMDVHGTLVTIESWAPHDRFATFQPLAEAFLASLSLDFGASGGH